MNVRKLRGPLSSNMGKLMNLSSVGIRGKERQIHFTSFEVEPDPQVRMPEDRIGGLKTKILT